MKVKILDAMMIGGKPQPEDTIIDLPDAFAAEQIAKARAVEAPPEPPKAEPPKAEPPSTHGRGSRR